MRTHHFHTLQTLYIARNQVVSLARERGWAIPSITEEQIRVILSKLGFTSTSSEQLHDVAKRIASLRNHPRRGGDKNSNSFIQALLAAACGFRSWEAMLPTLFSATHTAFPDPFRATSLHQLMPDADSQTAAQHRRQLLTLMDAPPIRRQYALVAMVEGAARNSKVDSETIFRTSPWIGSWAAATSDLLGLRMEQARPPESVEDKAIRMAETLADLTLAESFANYLVVALSDGNGRFSRNRGSVSILALPAVQRAFNRQQTFETLAESDRARSRIIWPNAHSEFTPLGALHQDLLTKGTIGRVGGRPPVLDSQ